MKLSSFVYPILIIILSPLVVGFEIWCLWDWFVVPVFGVNNIPIGASVGLSFVVNLFRNPPKIDLKHKTSDAEFEESFSVFLVSVTIKGVVLLLALFMKFVFSI